MKKRNLISIILLVVLSISAGFLYLKQEKQNPLTQNHNITKKEAEQLIRDMPEIQKLLEKYPKYTVEANTDEKSDSWLVWVYYLNESKSSTSTWGYFEVNKTTKKITPINPPEPID